MGALSSTLGVRLAEAAGLFDNTLCGLGRHQPDGDLTHVSDITLEQWAIWEGKRGRWATAFRKHCVDDDGAVRGWMRRQVKLLERQERDRLKRRDPRSAPTKPLGVSGGNPHKAPTRSEGHGNGNGNAFQKKLSEPRGGVAMPDLQGLADRWEPSVAARRHREAQS